MEKYGDINNLLSELDQNTQSEIEKLQKEFNEYKENKIKQTEREITVKKRRIISEAEKKAESIRKKVLSNLNVEINRIRLQKQGAAINQAYKKVVDYIDHIERDEKYQDLLLKLAEEAVLVLHEKKLEFIFAKEDEKIINDGFKNKFNQMLKGYNISPEDIDIQYDKRYHSGIVVKVKHKNVVYNNTLRAKLKRHEHDVMYSIHTELFGE